MSIGRQRDTLDKVDYDTDQQRIRWLKHHRRCSEESIDVDLRDIFDTLSTDLVTPQPGTDETVFSKAVEALDVYFNPKQNKDFQRYVFRHTNQERFESVEKLYMRLMQLHGGNMQFHRKKQWD